MNTSKIIKGVVGGGRYTVTAPIIKGDYGLYLKIEGVELPETYQVDFSNSENSGTSVTMIGNSDGVLIPSQFISSGKDVFAFLYHVGEDFGRTVYKFRIPNKVRPDRTEEAPTPEEQSTIDQAISALNTAVEQTAQDKADADANAQASAESAQASGESALSASNSALSSGEYASNALSYAESASASATASANSASASAQSASQAEQSAQTASQKADAITGLTATATTLPDGSSATASYDAETGVMSFGIPRGKDGINGDDGYSPTASVTKSGKVATITITDKNGTTSAQVEDGTDGTDGISPTVSITPITGGHRITITDADGEHSADVMDGDDYALTSQDKQDIAELVDVPVDDVQINGTSIVSDGVANVPIAGTGWGDGVTLGVVKANADNGIQITSTGSTSPTDAQIKGSNSSYRVITPDNQHKSVFYGLAKAAGDTTQSQSSNAVGEYTEDAKIAIQKMLGIYEAPWELIREDTFTNAEEADHIIDVDANGETFELTDVLLILAVPSHAEDTVIGDFGRVYFRNGTANKKTIYLLNSQSRTITAGSGENTAVAELTQDGSIAWAELHQWGPRTTRSARQIVYSDNEGGISTTNAISFLTDPLVITSLKIGSITGQLRYKLYGKRKWQ